MSSAKYILEELEELTPGFTWELNQPGFNVPEDYFERLPFRVQDKIQASLGEAGEWGKQNAYSVPDGYFDRVPQAVLNKVKQQTLVRQLPRRQSYWQNWVIAASMAAIIALGALLLLPQDGRRQLSLDRQLAGLSDDAIEQYLSMEVNAFNTDVSPVEDGLQNVPVNGLSNRDIEEYLDENISDNP